MNQAVRIIARIFIKNPPTIFFILATISFLIGTNDWTRDLLWTAILLQIAWIFILILAYISRKMIATSQPHHEETSNWK